MRKSVIVAGIVAGLSTAGAASAQDTTGQTSGQANVGMSLPGAQPATAAPGASDHEQVVGRLAVGYLGRATVGAGTVPAAGAPGPEGFAVIIPAPVIGIRYWVNSLLGIDAGIGIGMIGGSVDTSPGGAGDGDLDSSTAFLFHAGVPLSLASTNHFSFQIVPEANVGIGSAEQGDGDFEHSGFHFDIGARAGAEIHFGFMNIPQLSLQGSVGLLFAMDSASTDIADGPPDSVSASRTSLQTTVGSNPWNIFTSNVAAFYYF